MQESAGGWHREEPFYESLGFCENTGHKDYIIDERPYVGARVPT